MNVLTLFIPAFVLFYLAYKFYARYISKVFEEDDNNPTPACKINDGVDYVPTKPVVLFGHHFASIAGGGPIIGPTIALLFGYIPVWLWLVLGTIFIGAVHDFSTLFASVREKGRSISEVAQKSLGKSGFILFISFTIIMLLMVTSSFLRLTSIALTSLVPLNALGLDLSQQILKTKVIDNIVYAQIGGIASTSVIVITLFSPLVGYLLYRKNIKVYLAIILSISICFLSALIGIKNPVSLLPDHWMIILSVYTIFAAGVPVWIVLQPRDFTNSFLLYVGVLVLFLSTIVGGFKGLTYTAPAFNIVEGSSKVGSIFPFLFITVACGAVSGFHSLVSGGTSSKQVSKESHIKKIAYGGMILESILALGVLIAVGSGLNFSDYKQIVFPSAGKENPVLAFSLGMGGLLEKSFSIPAYVGVIFGILLVEGFVVTTLDTAVRLNRYLFEELWSAIFRNVPRIFKTYIFNSLLCVVLMFILSYFNTFLLIWPIFGAANQLLAALALLIVSAWLSKQKKRYKFVLFPAIFMMVITLFALIILLVTKYIPSGNLMLIVANLLLIILSVGVMRLAFGYKKLSYTEDSP